VIPTARVVARSSGTCRRTEYSPASQSPPASPSVPKESDYPLTLGGYPNDGNRNSAAHAILGRHWARMYETSRPLLSLAERPRSDEKSADSGTDVALDEAQIICGELR